MDFKVASHFGADYKPWIKSFTHFWPQVIPLCQFFVCSKPGGSPNLWSKRWRECTWRSWNPPSTSSWPTLKVSRSPRDPPTPNIQYSKNSRDTTALRGEYMQKLVWRKWNTCWPLVIFPKYSRKTPHNSPLRVSYGLSFLNNVFCELRVWSTVGCHYNTQNYNSQNNDSASLTAQWEFVLTNDTPNLALTDELWGYLLWWLWRKITAL